MRSDGLLRRDADRKRSVVERFVAPIGLEDAPLLLLVASFALVTFTTRVLFGFPGPVKRRDRIEINLDQPHRPIGVRPEVTVG